VADLRVRWEGVMHGRANAVECRGIARYGVCAYAQLYVMCTWELEVYTSEGGCINLDS
jgi:hypothetical protein